MDDIVTNNLTYSQFVDKLVKPPHTILETLTPDKVNLLHMVLGMSGEAGELLDNIKKYVIYNKSIDLINIIEELGDLLFYIEGIKNILQIKDREILMYNITKLSKRYEELTYSDKAAVERKDKDE